MPNRQIAAEGLEPPTRGLEVTVSDKTGGAKNDAQVLKRESASINCEMLEQVTDAWDRLSQSAKGLVASLVIKLID